MTNYRVAVVFACAMSAVAISAHAQDASVQSRPDAQIEVTPYAFLGSNASGGIGGAVRWPLPAHLSVELDSSVRRSEVAPFSANVSLLFDFPEVGRVTPYVAGGVGLDQYAYADQFNSGNVVAHAGTAVSVNAGGGVRIRSNETWGIRTDARWINGIGPRAPERWRLYNGVTFRANGR